MLSSLQTRRQFRKYEVVIETYVGLQATSSARASAFSTPDYAGG